MARPISTVRDDNEASKFTEDSIGDVCVATCDKDVLGALNNLGGTSDSTANIFNIAAGTSESSQALPTNTKSFTLKTRTNAKLQLSYTLGESGTKFITVPSNGVYNDDNFYASQTLFFRLSKSDTVEIVAFT